ncbi:MAG: indole-3-glycerol-phosphate synthase [Desulfomicrobium sp.]|nr:indole-3-glycerol-phosphate synthase [Pseudomonadota bacterium]MBV1712227.1 indole-3-glycerol-phosphate synthase [Desulfomicrobium sp.]MBU4572865.1 indole-3-glycerol-phosphate synthase [Pseudomonadota bacterium]MBU4594860.1 indole-3-glycerol-phosphate synthase [Pseudomonadota bacterium]MBV1718501.1 indole-3-glycerol-phosphate synthase [Desulfomicrobium sp.]
MLEKFRRAKQAEVDELIRLRDAGHRHAPHDGLRPEFGAALTRPGTSGIIAEYKRASPSRGDINLDVLPLQACRGYAEAGACALSILTESTYFKGDLSFLAEVAPLGLPLLRKDFIIHPLQVEATMATAASAILLIVRMFDELDELAQLHALCLTNGLEPVVEVFDERDLDRAKEIGSTIIQVNNRDLDTLTTDLGRCLDMVRRKQTGEIWIGASGINTPEQVRELKAAGLDALLIGTALMQHGDPGQGLAALTGGQS